MDNRISHRRPWFKSAWGLRLLHERRRLILPTMGRRRAIKSPRILRPCERPSAAHCWPIVAHLLSAGNRAQAAACVSATRSVVWVTTIACLLALWRVCCFVPHVGHPAWRVSRSSCVFVCCWRISETTSAGQSTQTDVYAGCARNATLATVQRVSSQCPCSRLRPTMVRTAAWALQRSLARHE